MSKNIFILTGQQGIGKSAAAAHIAALLGLENVVDEWIGSEELPDNALAITSTGISYADGWEDWVVIQVSSAIGLQALIRSLERAAASTIPIA